MKKGFIISNGIQIYVGILKHKYTHSIVGILKHNFGNID